MTKTIDLSKDVASLCVEYPELVDILVNLGFQPLANPAMRKMVGSFMTIPNASEMKKIPMDQILFTLAENGFAVTGEETVTGKSYIPLSEEEKKQHLNEPGHTFLARMGKTRLRPGGINATSWLLDQADITPATNILEVACNMATTLIEIAESKNCSHLTGLDLDQKALDHASLNIRKHHLEDRIALVQGSAFELPFPDESFDIVINEAMLTMLVGNQKDQALSEYYRVLKPGGMLLTQDVCMYTEDKSKQREIIAGISRAINVHVEPLTVKGWKEMMEGHGFSVKEKDGQMTLLDPEGMEHDEGSQRTMEILLNAMQAENADFFERMFTFFNTHKDLLGYCALAGKKTQGTVS